MTSRKDNKGRNLRCGEGQRPDGRYFFKYKDTKGATRTVYSWTLTIHDKHPMDKRATPPLRVIEKQIQKDLFDRVAPCDMTVLSLVERYVETKRAVRESTKTGYRTFINFLRADYFGSMLVSQVTTLDAKEWVIHLQEDCGKGHSSIHRFRGVVRPAFQLAEDDDLIRKNPFNFELKTIVLDDAEPRLALSRRDERRFLEFVKNDKHFSRYFNGFYILLNTGLRISEFCGLTDSDLDFESKSIRVDKQLMRVARVGCYIEATKTECGARFVPMSQGVERCFREMLESRPEASRDFSVAGVSGFLSFDKNGRPRVALHWEKYLRFAVEKFNRIHKEELPRITPHVCRHTFCSRMASNGMSPARLKYVMGHSDISVTYNVYTHLDFDDAKGEMLSILQNA